MGSLRGLQHPPGSLPGPDRTSRPRPAPSRSTARSRSGLPRQTRRGHRQLLQPRGTNPHWPMPADRRRTGHPTPTPAWTGRRAAPFFHALSADLRSLPGQTAPQPTLSESPPHSGARPAIHCRRRAVSIRERRSPVRPPGVREGQPAYRSQRQAAVCAPARPSKE